MANQVVKPEEGIVRVAVERVDWNSEGYTVFFVAVATASADCLLGSVAAGMVNVVVLIVVVVVVVATGLIYSHSISPDDGWGVFNSLANGDLMISSMLEPSGPDLGSLNFLTAAAFFTGILLFDNSNCFDWAHLGAQKVIVSQEILLG